MFCPSCRTASQRGVYHWMKGGPRPAISTQEKRSDRNSFFLLSWYWSLMTRDLRPSLRTLWETWCSQPLWACFNVRYSSKVGTGFDSWLIGRKQPIRRISLEWSSSPTYSRQPRSPVGSTSELQTMSSAIWRIRFSGIRTSLQSSVVPFARLIPASICSAIWPHTKSESAISQYAGSGSAAGHTRSGSDAASAATLTHPL